jgi:hypothetical protein
MTFQQGVHIACRALSVFFLFWVVTALTALPRESMVVWHYSHELSLARANPGARADDLAVYLLREYGLTLAETVLKIALWSMAAGYFYRCSPRILRFFAESQSESE